MNSIELEQALLGCLITNSDYVDSVKQYIPQDDFFYSSFNQKVWNAIDILNTRGEDIDLITVCEEVGTKVDGYSTKYEITGFLDTVTSASKAV